MTITAPPTTPDWLLAPQAPPARPRESRRRRSYLEKTLGRSSSLLREAMYAEDPADLTDHGWAHRVDPRVKLGALLALLVAVAVVHSPLTLLASYVGIVAVAAAAKVPLRSYLTRVWVFVPLFTALAVAPATLSFVRPGDIVVPLWTWHGAPVGLTLQGLTSAALVIGRVACSVSLVLLVTLTTPWSRLLAALGALGVPRMFVTIVAMAYRYVFVLLGTMTDMIDARRARTLGRVRHDASARRFVGSATGTLFGKAGHLAEEVHQAMTARGYRGRHHPLRQFRLGALDGVIALVTALAVLAVVGGDLALR